MSRAGDIHGTVVSEDEVASDLGFKSADDLKAWLADGGPTGCCSNGQCCRPAFWPDLEKPCKHCGSPITVDRVSHTITTKSQGDATEGG